MSTEPVAQEAAKVPHKALPPLAERLITRILNKLGLSPWWAGLILVLMTVAFDYVTQNAVTTALGIKSAAPVVAPVAFTDGATVRFEGKLFVADQASPKPEPKPADPNDQKRTSIIAGSGLRVMIVYESGKMDKLTKEQLAALWSADVVAYLNSKAPSRWKKYDQDANLVKELPGWQDVLKRPRASLPWLVVSNDAADFEGPYPGTVADVLALFGKYAPSVVVIPDKDAIVTKPLPPAPTPCANCGGTGQVRRWFNRTVTCSACSGMGVKP